MNVSTRTLQELGFPELLGALAARCRTELGRERALNRPFLETKAEVEETLRVVEEARGLSERRVTLSLGPPGDLRPTLERAEKGALLEARELLATAEFLSSISWTRKILIEQEELAPALAGARDGDCPPWNGPGEPHRPLLRAGRRALGRASPELKEARDRARGLHRAIKSRLDSLLHDEKFLLNLRESYYTLRNDRYVVPVLASARAEVPGIVHNASQSGQTLFVEPQAMIGMGNDLAIAQSVVLEEERRVLSGALRRGRPRGRRASLEGVDAAAELDEAEAAAQLGADLGASTPELRTADGPLELLRLRHPLLVLQGTRGGGQRRPS